MSRRDRIDDGKVSMTRPSRERIVAAQSALLGHLPHVVDPLHQCWACGAFDDDDLMNQRAHIKAAQHGGSCAPDNFFLLCPFCHFEQPDSSAVVTQLFWLMHHEPASERWARGWAPYQRAIDAGWMTKERAMELLRSRADDDG